MPTTYLDQFWVMDPWAPPPPGTALVVQKFTIIDQNDNSRIGRAGGDSIDGSDIIASYPGDTVTVVLSNGTTVTVTGVTFYLADGRQVFTPIDGSVLQNATFQSSTAVYGQAPITPPQLGPPCFTPGTLIRTETGEVPVEALRPGMRVVTLDRGGVAVALIHRRHLGGAYLRDRPRHAPVRIAAGALGAGLPRRDLLVSPQHRIMIASPAARRMFGSAEILAPACQLTDWPGIERMTPPGGGVDYIHILLDHHAVILAEGAPAETLFLGAQMHELLEPREVMRMRCALGLREEPEMQPARLLVRGGRLRQLLRRHAANGKPLLFAPPRPARSEGPCPAPRLAAAG